MLGVLHLDFKILLIVDGLIPALLLRKFTFKLLLLHNSIILSLIASDKRIKSPKQSIAKNKSVHALKITRKRLDKQNYFGIINTHRKC